MQFSRHFIFYQEIPSIFHKFQRTKRQFHWNHIINITSTQFTLVLASTIVILSFHPRATPIQLHRVLFIPLFKINHLIVVLVLFALWWHLWLKIYYAPLPFILSCDIPKIIMTIENDLKDDFSVFLFILLSVLMEAQTYLTLTYTHTHKN